MKTKTRTEFIMQDGAVGAIVALVLFASVFFYYVGTSYGEQTVTRAQTTVIHTVNFTQTQTTTHTNDIYITVTQQVFSVVTFIGPEAVKFSGKAHSNGVGTLPTKIDFLPQDGTPTITGNVASGDYSLTVPNHKFYIVKIEFAGPVAGVGSGICTAGGFGLFLTGNSTVADWGC